MGLAFDPKHDEPAEEMIGEVLDENLDEDLDDHIYLITDEPLLEAADAADFDDGLEM